MAINTVPVGMEDMAEKAKSGRARTLSTLDIFQATQRWQHLKMGVTARLGSETTTTLCT